MRGLVVGTSAFILVSCMGPALADRPVTDDERAKLEAALTAQGCTGGRLEFDDGVFEVDDAQCNDGRIYDLKFDRSFKLLEKKLEH
jgi:hypothetical protein